MNTSEQRESEYCLAKAAECRAMAAQASEGETRDTYTSIADKWERLAKAHNEIQEFEEVVNGEAA